MTQETLGQFFALLTQIFKTLVENTTPLRKKYPSTMFVLFFSSTADKTIIEDIDSDNYIENSKNGYLIELEKLGQSSDEIPTTSNNKSSNNPYSNKLRPISNLKNLKEANKVYLKSLEYFGYDTTLDTAGEGQTQTTIDDIVNSTNNDKFAHSQYKNALIPINWQPNYLRPQMRINGKEILKGFTSSNFGTNNNFGDLSIGIPHPACLNVDIELDKIKDIEAYGHLLQNVNGKLQRYPLLCLATFYVG